MENFPSNFAQDFLSLHNDYRAIHDSPPLRIDDWLNESAQEWADVLARKGVLRYRSDPNYGENIYASSWRDVAVEISPRDPLESWYREGKYFRYKDDDAIGLEDARHFTQVIWKETEFIGLGMASDENGKIYFVCVYYPPGNIAGKFADNVSPPVQEEEEELPPHEAKMIQTVKSNPDVVRSMERLYAVPSEKLRVWSIWLTKIGEMADEWQRWLRAHIDLAIRLAEQLQAAEGRVEQSEETDESSKVTVEETKVLSEAHDVDQDILRARSEIYPSIVTIVTEDMKEGTADEEAMDEGLPIWPIGTPWIHLGIEDEDDEQPFERLPLPRDEEEMRQFARKFTHEATIYRSYYKNWKETAEQATREIGGRAVIATYLAQGRNRFGKIKARPRPKLATGRKLSKRRSKKPQRKGRAKSDRKSSKRVSALSEQEKFFTTPEATLNADDKPVESPSKVDTVDEESDETTATGTEEPETAEEVKADEEETATGNSSKIASKTAAGTTSGTEGKVQVVEVDDVVRDCARAMEPVPYIFYLKVEPDIDIAIEHDDEEVIAADTDRENIVGAYKRLFFNLTDKPCKGGKPWML